MIDVSNSLETDLDHFVNIPKTETENFTIHPPPSLPYISFICHELLEKMFCDVQGMKSDAEGRLLTRDMPEVSPKFHMIKRWLRVFKRQCLRYQFL